MSLRPRAGSVERAAQLIDSVHPDYNKNCSLATTRWAILDWVKDGKFKDSIWSVSPPPKLFVR